MLEMVCRSKFPLRACKRKLLKAAEDVFRVVRNQVLVIYGDGLPCGVVTECGLGEVRRWG